jgi:hypothetical protein
MVNRSFGTDDMLMQKADYVDSFRYTLLGYHHTEKVVASTMKRILDQRNKSAFEARKYCGNKFESVNSAGLPG